MGIFSGETSALSPCVIRALDIESGFDETYNNIIVPFVLNAVSLNAGTNTLDILDIGCGCGFLTDKLGETNRVHGIDISSECIQYATERYRHASFEHIDVNEFRSAKAYDICVATMMVHLLSDYNAFLKRAANLLHEGGGLLIVIPHPNYWAAEKISGLEYAVEKKYSYDFKINGSERYWEIAYHHRTMETYITQPLTNGFRFNSFNELYEKRNGETARIPHLLGLSLSLERAGIL